MEFFRPYSTLYEALQRNDGIVLFASLYEIFLQATLICILATTIFEFLHTTAHHDRAPQLRGETFSRLTRFWLCATLIGFFGLIGVADCLIHAAIKHSVARVLEDWLLWGHAFLGVLGLVSGIMVSKKIQRLLKG